MIAPVDISVLVVNWNTRDLVVHCLDSLGIGFGNGTTFDVIVVDNGSSDGSREALERRNDIDLVENSTNAGYAAAVNQAYRRSTAPLVLLLNSDVELLRGSVAALARFLEQHPEVAGVAPLYTNTDGSPQPFHFRFPTFAVTMANASALVRRLPGMSRRLRRFRMLDDDFSQPRPVPQPSASCLLIRRAVLPEGHVFDERYPIFLNDVQLARRLAAEGRELWVTPHSVVVHEGHASTRQLGGSLKRQYIASVVRMLEETEPRRNLLLYRLLVLAQGAALLALRRPEALGWGDLRRAIAGDPGELPTRPQEPG